MLRTDPKCVCGCSEGEHLATVMSVPMKAGLTRYRVVGTPQIFMAASNATYTNSLCGCGCSIFEADKV